jgi:putative peptide zinc metalloprotease protein
MSAETKTFSESWYRLAGQRVAVRSHVRVQRQMYRGERYHVLHDPFNNQFFRLRPEAYAFVARLRLDRTVEEVWKDCLETDPEGAPGQEDVLQLLAALHGANLLHSNLSPDSAKLFERHSKRRTREVRGALIGFMSARFPIFDPDALLRTLRPLLERVISPLGGLVWLAIVGVALKVVLDHSAQFADQSQSMFAPGNLVLLYVGLVLIKLVHEFGHAAMCRRFGGEVHVLGVMFVFLTPMPYVDTTSSWGFRSRWHRALVGAGGMIAELMVAAAAVFVWASTAEGAVNALAYNIIFVASVSTVLFNINPLLRFDGYYILSDLLEIPNLQARSDLQIGHLVERYLFGRKQSHSPALTFSEAAWLAFYGVASKVYRFFLFAGILLFLANRYLLLGLLMAVGCAFSWVVKPIFNGLRYLAFSPRLVGRRGHAVAMCAGAAAALVAVLEVIPVPEHFRAPGVIEAVEHSLVSSEVNGRVANIVAVSGSEVKRGQPLVELVDPELPLQIAGTTAQLEETRAMRQRAMDQSVAELKAIDGRIEATEKQLRRFEEQQAALIVRAPHDGLWIAPDLDHYRGTWLARGTELGQVVNPKTFRFSAVVSENDASRLFEGSIRSAEVRLHGQAALALKVREQRIIQAEQEVLPSAALGWKSGGEIAVSVADQAGVKTREPFFAVQALIEPREGVELLHGGSGKIRFEMPSQPLLGQWWRRVMQLLQKHHGL